MDSLHEDLRTLILLATARNTLQLDNSVKVAPYCISTTTMNTSILFTAIRRSTIEGTYWYTCMAIMVIRTLPAYLVPCSRCQLKIGNVGRVNP